MRCVVFATREFEQQTPWSVTKVFNFIFSISRLELFHARRLYTQWKKIQEETNEVFANIFYCYPMFSVSQLLPVIFVFLV